MGFGNVRMQSALFAATEASLTEDTWVRLLELLPRGPVLSPHDDAIPKEGAEKDLF